MPTRYHRWFLLPVVEYSTGAETVREPKLVGQDDRLDGYTSGGPFTRQQVEDAGYANMLAYNDAEDWRVVVAWGEGNDGWQALNEIHANYHDTATLAGYQQDVAPVLDDRFGQGNWAVDAQALNDSQNNA